MLSVQLVSLGEENWSVKFRHTERSEVSQTNQEKTYMQNFTKTTKQTTLNLWGEGSSFPSNIDGE